MAKPNLITTVPDGAAARAALDTAIDPSAARGVPSERLQKLLLSTTTPEPWAVTDQIVIEPPTKRRRQQLADAEMAIAVQQKLLGEAMKHVLSRRPEYPSPPATPDKGASKATYSAYNAAAARFGELVEAWSRLNTEWEASVEHHQQVIAEISARIVTDSEAYTRALFGTAYDDVIAFFDEQPAEIWELFKTEIQYHFHLAVRPPEVPDDGICSQCGHADEEQAGKAPEPST